LNIGYYRHPRYTGGDAPAGCAPDQQESLIAALLPLDNRPKSFMPASHKTKAHTLITGHCAFSKTDNYTSAAALPFALLAAQAHSQAG
jgi:hypothetical protein